MQRQDLRRAGYFGGDTEGRWSGTTTWDHVDFGFPFPVRHGHPGTGIRSDALPRQLFPGQLNIRHDNLSTSDNTSASVLCYASEVHKFKRLR